MHSITNILGRLPPKNKSNIAHLLSVVLTQISLYLGDIKKE